MYVNYGGNWTAFFVTGDVVPCPPELAARTYVFHGTAGYDGQFYRYVAHAPWFRADWLPYFDSARLRYSRILIPALAWTFAAGMQTRIDAAYIAVILGWVFLGVYWLGRLAVEQRSHPACGLAFLLLPATLVSIDRMTVDVALAALCIAFVRSAKRQSPGGLYAVLLMAALVRESGLILVAAQCAYDLAAKRWRQAFAYATAAVPALGWYAYVWTRAAMAAAADPRIHTPIVPRWLFQDPGIGIVIKLFHPDHYAGGAWPNWALQFADTLALCAFLALVASGIWSLRRRPWNVEQWAISGFVLLALMTSTPTFWGNVYTYARPYSPLIFLAALGPWRTSARWVYAPVLLIAFRTALQLAPQTVRILHAFL